MSVVAFIVNGDENSAMAQRAGEFARLLRDRHDIRVVFRSRNKISSIVNFLRFLRCVRPAVTYVFDMSYSGMIAAIVYRWMNSNNRLVVDTGDAIYELACATGRGMLGRWLTWLLEKVSLRSADRIVVRGTFHQTLLENRGITADLIHDGVDVEQFAPRDAAQLRREMQLDGVLTVGLIGTSNWNPRAGTCYGWDLVEAIRLLRDEPVKGIMIGGGSGIDVLRRRCREYGIEERAQFLGHVSYEKLPDLLAVIDVCLSTQTNDIPGQVRTTGKLPLYLAAGRYVLASRVGEAVRVLDECMLVDYEGKVDSDYPRQLAKRIRAILNDPSLLERARQNIDIARARFDYGLLAEKLGWILQDEIDSMLHLKRELR